MPVINIVEVIDGKYKFNELLLRSVVKKAIDCCDSFAVISIIGPKLEGKTFLINCLLNYLESKDKTNWPNTANTTITWNYGFRNNYCEGKHPVIQIWSEPFILMDENQRIGVFLMDSSDVFNSFHEITESKLSNDIIKLFLNTSSTVIFNTSCRYLTKYDRNLLKQRIEDSFEFIKPIDSYQKLFILVRDWDIINGNKEFCGDKEGEEYLNIELKSLELDKYWHKTECYLIPSPDSNVRQTNWKLSELKDQFIKQLSEFIKTKLLNVNEMQIKTRVKSNQPIKAIEFINLFKDFIQQLNESNTEIEGQEITQRHSVVNKSLNDSMTKNVSHLESPTIFGQINSPVVLFPEAKYEYGIQPNDNQLNNSFSYKSDDKNNDSFNTSNQEVSDNSETQNDTTDSDISNQTIDLSSDSPLNQSNNEINSQKDNSNQSNELQPKEDQSSSSEPNSPVINKLSKKASKGLNDKKIKANVIEITKSQLEEFNRESINSYKESILKHINSENFDFGRGLSKAHNDLKSKAMTLFDEKFKSEKQKKLVKELRNQLIISIEKQKGFFIDLIDDRLKNTENDYELVLKNSINFFNTNIRKAIELDIKTNNYFEKFSEIFKEMNKNTIEEFESKSKNLFKGSIGKKFINKLDQSLNEEKRKYWNLYNRYETYKTKCEQQFKTQRYFAIEELHKIQSELKFNESVVEFKEQLKQMIEKANNEYEKRLIEISKKEKQIAEKAIELAVDLYTNCLDNKLKSGLFSQNDIKIINQKLLDYTLNVLNNSCQFNSDQQMLIKKCENGLKSKVEQKYEDLSAKHKRIFTKTTDLLNRITNELYRKYCTDMKSALSDNNYLKPKDFKELHQRIENDLMVVQKKRLKDIKTDFSEEFANKLFNENEIDIKNSIMRTKEQLIKQNDSKAPKTSSIVIHFCRQYYTSAYFDGNIEFVLDKMGSKLRPNCIAFSDNFMFGSEAKNYLQKIFCDKYNDFDIKQLIGREHIIDSELNLFPFRFVSQNPPKVEFESTSLKIRCILSIESLIALQVLDIKSDAEKQLNSNVTNAVFTVPTHFNIRQRNAFRDVATIAGLESVHILSEITAAAIAYAFDENRHKTKQMSNVLILLLDEFECEVSVCKVKDNSIQLIAYNKSNLSSSQTSLFDFRSIFRSESEKYCNALKRLIDTTLHESHCFWPLNHCVIAGQSLLMPQIKEWIANSFGSIVLFECNPLDVIINGSTLYSQMLENKLEMIEITGIAINPITYTIKDKSICEKNKFMTQKNVPLPYSSCRTTSRIPDSYSLPLNIFIEENETTVKLFQIKSFPFNANHIWRDLDIKYEINGMGDMEVKTTVATVNKKVQKDVEMSETKLGLTEEQINNETKIIMKFEEMFKKELRKCEQKLEIKKTINDLQSYYIEMKKSVDNYKDLSRIKRKRIDTELDKTLQLIRSESNDTKAIEEQKQQLKKTIEMLLKK